VLNATDYGNVTEVLTESNTWISRAENVGKSTGVHVDYRYGTRAIGGSPREPSVKLIEAIEESTTAIFSDLRYVLPADPPATAGALGPSRHLGALNYGRPVLCRRPTAPQFVMLGIHELAA
jgi:hypothetical protein